MSFREPKESEEQGHGMLGPRGVLPQWENALVTLGSELPKQEEWPCVNHPRHTRLCGGSARSSSPRANGLSFANETARDLSVNWLERSPWG